MAKTLLQIRSMVRQHIDEIDATDLWTNSELDDYINRGQRWLLSELLKTDPTYRLKNVTDTMVIGTSKYSFPSDMYGAKVSGIFVYTSAVATRYDLKNKSPELISKMQPYSGLPRFYVLFKDSFVVGPKPDAAYTYEIWYVADTTDLSAESDVTTFDDKEVDIVGMWAAMRALRNKGYDNSADQVLAEISIELSQLAYHITPDTSLAVGYESLDDF